MQVPGADAQHGDEVPLKTLGERIGSKSFHPQPGKSTEADFEAARPIDANGVRILRTPVVPLRDDLIHEPPIIRDGVSFGQRNQMLVPVQFPDNFRVADFLIIEITDLEPGLARRLFTADSIEVPVDFASVIKAFITEQVEAMCTDFFGSGKNLAGFARELPLQDGNDLWQF